MIDICMVFFHYFKTHRVKSYLMPQPHYTSEFIVLHQSDFRLSLGSAQAELSPDCFSFCVVTNERGVQGCHNTAFNCNSATCLMFTELYLLFKLPPNRHRLERDGTRACVCIWHVIVYCEILTVWLIHNIRICLFQLFQGNAVLRGITVFTHFDWTTNVTKIYTTEVIFTWEQFP